MELIKEWYRLRVLSSGTDANFEIEEVDGFGLRKEFRKLYAVFASVKGKEQCWYIGEAATDMRTRFQRSFYAYRHYKRLDKKVQGGYIGYKWIEPASTLSAVRIMVVTFCEPDLNRKTLEAIEGQLVFMVRNHTGQWPLWQNEIHFWNEHEEHGTIGSKAIAERIFSEEFAGRLPKK